MPCQSYEPEDSRIDERALRDKLARIACKALTHIEDADDGGLEKLILQDPEIAEWWRAHKAADRLANEKKRVAEEKSRIRAQALSKLSAEERRILGIK
jgi:hypothetical protein